MVLPAYRRERRRTRELAQFRESGPKAPLSGVLPPGFREQDESEAPVKSFSLLKLPLLLAGFGALLLFSPACKAQSEVNPDHFDGTDTWEVAARKPVTAQGKVAQKSGTLQAQSQKASTGASVQLAAVRDMSNPAPVSAVAVEDKRKTAVRKSNKP
jgi:hypothetical protein